MKKIGRSELIDLPEMGLYGLSAKVDTGAYTSCIHCKDAQVVDFFGCPILHFSLLAHPSRPEWSQRFYFSDFQEREVKNSSGQKKKRYVIQTAVCIFGEQILTEFTLNDRSNLKFPILLGRKFLKSKFIVDVTKTNLSITRLQNVV